MPMSRQQNRRATVAPQNASHAHRLKHTSPIIRQRPAYTVFSIKVMSHLMRHCADSFSIELFKLLSF